MQFPKAGRNTLMKIQQYRQGDVLLEQIPSLPDNLKRGVREEGRIIVARGESTGHSHVIADAKVQSFVDSDGNLFLEVAEQTEVVHEEHATLTLPPGVYRITHQREYNPVEIRRVRD